MWFVRRVVAKEVVVVVVRRDHQALQQQGCRRSSEGCEKPHVWCVCMCVCVCVLRVSAVCVCKSLGSARAREGTYALEGDFLVVIVLVVKRRPYCLVGLRLWG